jgi:hypothetical protein
MDCAIYAKLITTMYEYAKLIVSRTNEITFYKICKDCYESFQSWKDSRGHYRTDRQMEKHQTNTIEEK